jgi:hypothetical protein
MLPQFTVLVMMLSGLPAMLIGLGAQLSWKRLVFVAVASVALASFTLRQIRLLAGATTEVTRLHPKYLNYRDRQNGQADQEQFESSEHLRWSQS